MKTGKWGKTILALLLAVMMILPSVAAMAEAVEGEPSYEGTPIDVTNATVYVYDFETGEWSEDEELTESMKLEGDLTVDVENVQNYDAGPDPEGWGNDDPNALTVDAEGTEESFEVTGSVSVDIVSKKEDYSWADSSVTAAEVSATNGGSADLTVGGGISASVESTGDYTYSYSYGLNTYADDGSTVKVTAGGDVSATTVVIDKSEEGRHAEEATSAAVQVQGRGDTTIFIDGNAVAEATAPEGNANAGAVHVHYGEGHYQEPMNEDEEESTSSITVTVKKDATATATVGNRHDVDESGHYYSPAADAGAITVMGYEGQTVEVTVDGHAEAEATNNGDGMAYAMGIYAVTYGEGADVTITVLQGVEATATAAEEEDESAAAIATQNNDGSIIGDGMAYANGIYAVTYGEGADVTITVLQGVEATATAAEEEDENAAAIATQNSDGSIIVNVTGDAISSDIGIVMEDQELIYVNRDKPYEGEIIPSEDDESSGPWHVQVIDGEKVYYKTDGAGNVTAKYCTADYREGGESFVTVVGNVTADDTAIAVNLTEAESTMEVTVTETVEGKEHAIVLSEETIAENLTLTVWEVKPNKDGNIVERAKEETDEEGNTTTQYTADKDTEKLIQYIIKIEDNSKDYITSTGTKDFTASNGETYQVANEGDKILVKLNIPEGKELVGAYWDVDQTEEGKLLVDSEGNYYLEVPRGGGVELSLIMKDLPKPDPKPAPAQATVFTLLTITDKTEEAKIIFYSDGTYKAVIKNNGTDEGTYKLDNDQIVLTSKDGKTMPMTKSGDVWKLSFTGGTDQKTYEIEVSDERVQKLIEALKK